MGSAPLERLDLDRVRRWRGRGSLDGDEDDIRQRERVRRDRAMEGSDGGGEVEWSRISTERERIIEVGEEGGLGGRCHWRDQI